MTGLPLCESGPFFPRISPEHGLKLLTMMIINDYQPRENVLERFCHSDGSYVT